MSRFRSAISVPPDGQASDQPPAGSPGDVARHTPGIRTPGVPRLLTGGSLVVIVLLLGALAQLGSVARFDLGIDQHIAARDRTAGLTAVAKAISLAGDPAIGIALTVVLPVILVLLRRRRDAVAAFCMFAGALGLAEMAKLIINEHRPPLSLQAAGADLSPSYPSGHTTTAAIIVVTLTVIAATVAGRVIAIAIGIPYALAVAASRLYLGYHFPLDLVGAFLCALAAAFIVTGLAALPAVRIYLDRLTPAGGNRRQPGKPASCCYLGQGPVVPLQDREAASSPGTACGLPSPGDVLAIARHGLRPALPGLLMSRS